MDTNYVPPLSLTILGAIFLLLGVLCAIVVALDILIRQGWRSMMAIMIPTYIITALYFGPFALWIYFRYGRAKPRSALKHHEHSTNHNMHMDHHHHINHDQTHPSEGKPQENLSPKNNMHDHHHMHSNPESEHSHHMHNHHLSSAASDEKIEDHLASYTDHNASQKLDLESEPNPMATMQDHHNHDHSMPTTNNTKEHAHDHMHHSSTTPFYVSVLIGVTHCGAGCVLGDIVGEWLVYGTNPLINGRTLWPEMLIDYAFALLFGILFQYFSIAPMSGEWGAKSLIRAAKADIASLTTFEIGLFGWMAAYQIGIWRWRLGVVTTVYWWMMQVGMVLGFITAFPMNWVLIKVGIKEPHVM